MMRIAVFGATSAIAEAVARLFAAEGAHLVVIARQAQRLAAIRGDLLVRGAAAVESRVADLADLAALPDLVRDVFTIFGGLDVVLIAHGSLGDQAAGQQDFAVAARELTINLLSPLALLTTLAPLMESQGNGTLAVIGSVAGDRGRQSNYIYGTAKGGLSIFVQGLRHRLARVGVKVVLIKPGFVDTPMTAAFPKSPLWASPERVAKEIRRALLVRKPAVLYTPWFWRWIMLIIRLLPDAVIHRTRL